MGIAKFEIWGIVLTTEAQYDIKYICIFFVITYSFTNTIAIFSIRIHSTNSILLSFSNTLFRAHIVMVSVGLYRV